MKREIAMLHSKLPIFAKRVASANRIIEKALLEMRYPYVAFSSGKDSTVVFNLVREYLPYITGIWSDDVWFFPETLEYVQRLRKNGLDIKQIRTNAWHTDWFQTTGDWNGIPDYARQHHFDGVFLGLRQEESTARRIHLRTKGGLFFAKQERFWQCNPIHNWTWRDVWAYIFSNDLDYNKAYDRFDEIGIEPKYQRIGPFAVERVLGYGQIAIIKRGWPDLYNKFVAEHPEAGFYV